MAQKRRPSGSSCRAGLVLGPAGSRPALCALLCLLFGRIPGNSAPGTTNLSKLESHIYGGRKAHTSLSRTDMHTVSCRFSLCAVELPASCAGAAVRAPASQRAERVVRVSSAVFVRRVATFANGTLADAACGFHCGLFCVCLLRVRLLRLVTHRVRKDGLAGGVRMFYCGLFCDCLLRGRLLRPAMCRVRKDGLAGGNHVFYRGINGLRD